MVSVPFHLVVLVELVILESLVIAGFFAFRWWRERQDQVVLEALVTATETSALARNSVLKAKLAEVAPGSEELAKQVEDLAQAEILFQRRLIAAFRHERLLSLGHLPLWTEELLVPYQALMGGVQSTLATSVREHQKEVERKVEHLTAELTHSKEELQQTRQKIEALDVELTSTKEELAEKSAKVDSLEREYVSAFHHSFATNGQPSETPPGEQAATPPPAEAKTPPPQAASHESKADEGIVIENEDEGATSSAGGDLTIDEGDDDVPTVDESDSDDAAPAANAIDTDADLDWGAALAEQAASEVAADDQPGMVESTTDTAKAESEKVIDSEGDDVELDWGAALAEQAASEEEADAQTGTPEPIQEAAEAEELIVADDDAELDWGAALAEQAANNTVDEADPVQENIEEIERSASDDENADTDLDWGSALAEQAAADATPDDKKAIKNAG